MANSPAAGTVVDPYRAYHFKIEFQGTIEGHFTECSPLGATVLPIRFREAGASQIVRCLPGPVQYHKVTLHYGITQSRDLWEWFLTAVRGKAERRNVSVVLFDQDGITEVLRWNLLNAWPSMWRGAPLDALGGEIAIATLELVYDSLEQA
jgi:phage tail-like protein